MFLLLFKLKWNILGNCGDEVAFPYLASTVWRCGTLHAFIKRETQQVVAEGPKVGCGVIVNAGDMCACSLGSYGCS